ncbi:MAG: hypothetical protein R2873_20010 [Caldilineaceae bacterium]
MKLLNKLLQILGVNDAPEEFRIGVDLFGGIAENVVNRRVQVGTAHFGQCFKAEDDVWSTVGETLEQI